MTQDIVENVKYVLTFWPIGLIILIRKYEQRQCVRKGDSARRRAEQGNGVQSPALTNTVCAERSVRW